MAEEKAREPFTGDLDVVRNMEITSDGKVLVMLGKLVVEDGLIVRMDHRNQLNLEVNSGTLGKMK